MLTYPPQRSKSKKLHFYPSKRIPKRSRRVAQVIELGKIIISALEPIEKISGHGGIPLVLGAWIAYSGFSEMYYRTIGLMFFALWLSLDSAVWVFSKKRKPSLCKSSKFYALTSIWLIIAILLSRGMLIDKLKADQNESYMKLTALLILPPNRLPENSIFTVTNDGSNDVVVMQIICGINKMHYPGSVVQDYESVIMYEGETILGFGGGKQSEACVTRGIAAMTGGVQLHPSCVGLTMTVIYELTEQPNTKIEKRFRYLYTPTTGSWISELVTHKGYYCA